MWHPKNQPLKINLLLMLSAKVIHWFSYQIGVGEIWERVECMTVTHWHRHAGLQTMSESTSTYYIRARVGTRAHLGLNLDFKYNQSRGLPTFCIPRANLDFDIRSRFHYLGVYSTSLSQLGRGIPLIRQ